MDDETYVFQNPSLAPGQKMFAYEPGRKKKVKPNQKFMKGDRYAKKFLIWQAIAENGEMSKPVVIDGTLNGEQYLEQIIKPVSLP